MVAKPVVVADIVGMDKNESRLRNEAAGLARSAQNSRQLADDYEAEQGPTKFVAALRHQAKTLEDERLARLACVPLP